LPECSAHRQPFCAPPEPAIRRTDPNPPAQLNPAKARRDLFHRRIQPDAGERQTYIDRRRRQGFRLALGRRFPNHASARIGKADTACPQ
jgi:hypothetical protein